MEQVESQISTAQWMLERQLYWIAQAEIKVAAVVTIDIAMLGGLFATWGSVKAHPTWCVLFSSACIGLLCGAVVCAAMTLMPRVLPASYISGLFFGQVADFRSASDFAEAHKRKTPIEILDDWLHQVHRNAEIAKVKHSWVRKALVCSFLGAACWVAAVLMLVEI